MLGLNHFAIADEENHDRFMDLVVMSEDLDKEDFLETSYFVNERELQKMAGIESSSSRKGKERAPSLDRDDEEEEQEECNEEEEEETAVDLSSQGGDLEAAWHDPILDTFPEARSLAMDLGDPLEGSGVRGLSTSVEERVNITPSSNIRYAKKK